MCGNFNYSVFAQKTWKNIQFKIQISEKGILCKIFLKFQTWIGFFSTFFEQNQKNRKLRTFNYLELQLSQFSAKSGTKILHFHFFFHFNTISFFHYFLFFPFLLFSFFFLFFFFFAAKFSFFLSIFCIVFYIFLRELRRSHLR